MLKAFKYRLYPNREQRKAIDFTLERCRLLYNRLLEERIHAYKSEGKSVTYYIKRTRSVSVSGVFLRWGKCIAKSC